MQRKKTVNQRKYRTHLLAAFLITLGFVLTGSMPNLSENFSVFVFGILTASGVYKAANVMNKKVLADKGLLPRSDNPPEV